MDNLNINPKNKIDIYPENFSAASIRGLYIEMYFNDTLLSHGSAFLGWTRVYENGKSNAKSLIFTARHNLTGKQHFSDANGEYPSLSKSRCLPNNVVVHFSDRLGSFFSESFQLYADGFHESQVSEERLWIEHPQLNGKVDVAALVIPVDIFNRIHSCAFIELGEGLDSMEICTPVHLVGFPVRCREIYFSVISSASVAYEPSFDFPLINREIIDLLPVFLMDARTFHGQSGSFVFYGSQPRYWGGQFQYGAGGCDRILGLYSGRLNDETSSATSLGIVWKCEILLDFLTLAAADLGC